MKEYFTSQYNLLAGEKDFFTFEDFKNIKQKDPDFLSIIEDIGDMSLENTLINEKKQDDSVTRAEFEEYHGKVLELFEETQDELKKKFELKPDNPLIIKIGQALK